MTEVTHDDVESLGGGTVIVSNDGVEQMEVVERARWMVAMKDEIEYIVAIGVYDETTHAGVNETYGGEKERMMGGWQRVCSLSGSISTNKEQPAMEHIKAVGGQERGKGSVMWPV